MIIISPCGQKRFQVTTPRNKFRGFQVDFRHTSIVIPMPNFSLESQFAEANRQFLRFDIKTRTRQYLQLCVFTNILYVPNAKMYNIGFPTGINSRVPSSNFYGRDFYNLVNGCFGNCHSEIMDFKLDKAASTCFLSKVRLPTLIVSTGILGVVITTNLPKATVP